MSELGRDEIINIAHSVGSIQGWDFSPARVSIDPVPWEYREVVRKFLRPQHDVLDVATGGGEIFTGFSAHIRSGLGVDSDPAMINTAIANAHHNEVSNIDFQVMPAQSLTLPDDSFDVVLNRHGPVFPQEIVRVMRPRGVFITHQVGGRNFQSIFDAFNFGFDSNGDYWQHYWKKHSIDPQDQPSLILGFKHLGCRIVGCGEYDVPYYFSDVESLVFFLKAVPLPEEFNIDRHWRSIQLLLKTHETSRGIRTNEHRELLIVERPSSTS